MTNIVNKWNKFITGNLIASAVVLYLQIPHTIAAADCFLVLGIGLSHYNPVLDFILYGIDLLEIIPIIGVTTTLIYLLKQRIK